MNPSIKSLYHLIILSSIFSCTKPQITPIPPEAPNNAISTDTLTFFGYYHPKDCRFFINARMNPTGELVPDDTVDPQTCDEEPTSFKLETVRFPVPGGTDRFGLRFTLNQYLLLHAYRFIPEGFQLSSSQLPNDPISQNPNFQTSQLPIYTFASPGKQHLQVFFPDTMLTTPVRQHQYNFTFQLVRGRGEAPKFTLLEGTYDPTTNLVATPDLVNFQNLPDLNPNLPGNYADSFSSSVRFQLLDSTYILNIRSIYHLLTEDFALWNEDTDCRQLQNWDLQLIPATGYNLLEAKLDPPFLECLRTGEEPIYFRIALLR